MTDPSVKTSRSLFEYGFEGGATVAVIVRGTVDTATVLWALDELIPYKRREIERLEAARPKEDYSIAGWSRGHLGGKWAVADLIGIAFVERGDLVISESTIGACHGARAQPRQRVAIEAQ